LGDSTFPVIIYISARVEVYFLLMGSDIRAPVGLEWRAAHRAHRPILAFLKHGVARTPAGQAFVRETEVTWQPFTNATDLTTQVQRLLVNHLDGS
jgi:hypothetical protein